MLRLFGVPEQTVQKAVETLPDTWQGTVHCRTRGAETLVALQSKMCIRDRFKVYCTQSTFYMEPEEEDVDMDLAFERVSKVFGLSLIHI